MFGIFFYDDSAVAFRQTEHRRPDQQGAQTSKSNSFAVSTLSREIRFFNVGGSFTVAVQKYNDILTNPLPKVDRNWYTVRDEVCEFSKRSFCL